MSNDYLSIKRTESFHRGAFVGNYVIQGKLGEGSFGKVLLGVHKDTQKKYAIKCIEMKNTKVINNVMRETNLQRLLDHPNIVHLYEVFQVPEQNMTCMVLELVNGGELFDYIVTRGKVEEKDAIRLFRQMISAIEYCHHSLVIHRDLKPENILLDENRNAKIMDFGLANMMQAGSFLHTNCGSPIYSSPEILQSKDYIGPEVDIWSLGVILYVMVTGMCPWSGTTLTEQLKNAVVGRFEPAEDVSDECSNLIERIITVDPKKRPTIAEIRNHPWVNRGYATRPLSSVPSSRRIKPLTPNELDEEAVSQVMDLGFDKDTIIRDVMANNSTSPSYVYYHLCMDAKDKQIREKMANTSLAKTWSPEDFERLKGNGNSLPPEVATSKSMSRPSSGRGKDDGFLPQIRTPQPEQPSLTNSADVLLSPTSAHSSHTKKRISIGLESIFKGGNQKSTKSPKPKTVKRMVLDKTSSKTAEELQAEIERTIGVMKLTFKANGLKWGCKEDVMDDKLKFDVEICRAEKEELLGITFKRKSGSIWHYKDTVNRFCNTLNL